MTGLVVGLGVALPILIFATANIFTGLLATCSIVLSTLSVVAVIPLGGWKLGVGISFKVLHITLDAALTHTLEPYY